MKLTVVTPGLLTTLQDEGRYGYQASGFSVSGCMDKRAMREANALVNNRLGEAVLEMQVLGGSFRFEGETYFALTGADMQPLLSGRPVQRCRAYKAQKGDVLECRMAASGRFAYLAVAGGFDAAPVLGSRSTNLKCAIGGFSGRALKAGDEPPLRRETAWLWNGHLKEIDSTAYGGEICLRTTAGPQEDRFTEKGLADFYSQTYTVTDKSDRMGYRLDGVPIESKNGVDIISDAIVEGSVQVPSNGKPMILLADRQTPGGYTKIATVIAADIPLLVQCMPGARVRFQRVSLEEAVRLLRTQERSEKRLLRAVGYARDNQGPAARRLALLKEKLHPHKTKQGE